MLVGLVGAGRIGAFHAETLRDLPDVARVVVADADASRAEHVADKLNLDAAGSVEDLFNHGLDAVVIAAATEAHGTLVMTAADAGVPVFCEKPLAHDVAGTKTVMAHVEAAGVPLQVGFQRRFDAGYRAARAAARDGRLGWLHTLRATTYDPVPPSAAYIASSGGLYRDCLVHDFDAIRWLTGLEIERVYATGANRGESFFTDAEDVDTAAVVATLTDGVLAVISGGRYNGGGYDVRMEVHGSAGTIAVGLDEATPVTSAEPGVSWPPGPACPGFPQRFRQAYAAELSAFIQVCVQGTEPECVGADALEALYVADACELSRANARVVEIAEVRS